MKEPKIAVIFPEKTSTTIRLTPDLLKKLKRLAEEDGRSFNNYVVRLLMRSA
jgi:predicted DNA-binding protein